MQSLLPRVSSWIAIALGLLPVAAATAQAAWPDKPIKVIVGASPGGSNDLVGRGFATALANVLKKPVIVENRPGVGSSIAADLVAKAPPDGYTLFIASPAAISVNPALDARWAQAASLVPIAQLAGGPLVMVANSQSGIKNVQDFIAYAKQHEKSSFASGPGTGTAPHLAMALFNQLTGTRLQYVPFKGGAEAVMSVMTGDSQVSFATSPSVVSSIQAGRLTPLAVSTPQRSAIVPDVPGMKEAGVPHFNLDFWCGLFAPPNTSPEILKKIYEATKETMQTKGFRNAMESAGMEVARLPASEADFKDFLVTDNPFWARLARESGAKLQ